MNRSNKIGWAQVRGGIFVFLALVFFAGGVLMMGQKTKMFVTKGTMRIQRSLRSAGARRSTAHGRPRR